MAQKKNCNKRRLQNLSKLPSKNVTVPRQPTVEDVTDSESESDEFDDNFSPFETVASSEHSGDDSEFEMESDDEDDMLKEIQTDSELLAFASRLQMAHDEMVSNEKAKRATKKRKATYLGNSNRSKRRWRAEGKMTEAAGFPSVSKFFQKRSEKENPLQNPEISAEVTQVSNNQAKCSIINCSDQ